MLSKKQLLQMQVNKELPSQELLTENCNKVPPKMVSPLASYILHPQKSLFKALRIKEFLCVKVT